MISFTHYQSMSAVWKHNSTHLLQTAGYRKENHAQAGWRAPQRTRGKTYVKVIGKMCQNFFKKSICDLMQFTFIGSNVSDLHFMQVCFCLWESSSFAAHSTVRVLLVNYSVAVSFSELERWGVRQARVIFTAYSEFFLQIYKSRTLTAHLLGYHCAHLPVGHEGQQLHQIVATEPLRKEDEGEPSSLAGAPLLCRAVCGDKGMKGESVEMVSHEKHRRQIIEMEGRELDMHQQRGSAARELL